MSSYKVVVKGEILPGHAPEAVKNNIAALFKLDSSERAAQTLARFFSGKPFTVKKGLEHPKAQAYQQAIRKAGMACEVVAEEATAGTPPPPAARAAFEARELRPANEHIVLQEAGAKSNGRAEFNPYQQPQADLGAPADEGDFALVEPQKLPAGAGWGWIKEGYYYFRQNPGSWVLACIVFFILYAILSSIPLVSLAVSLIAPVFTAGFMLGCYKAYQGENFSVGELFSGFKSHFGALVMVGLINLLLTVAVIAVAAAVMIAFAGMEGVAMLGQMQNAPDPAGMMTTLLLMAVLVVALLVPVMMAYFFAPALVAIHGEPAVRACVLSFRGCLRNVLPFTVYGLAMLLLFFAAVIPIGLGLLIMVPVMFSSVFAAYRQIYTHSQLPD